MSAEYAAPEMLRGKKATEAADWWSLGVILYELTTGRNPFKGGSEEDTRANVAGWKKTVQRITRSRYFAEETVDLLGKLLRGPPEYRPCGVEEIREHPFFNEVDMDDIISELVEY